MLLLFLQMLDLTIKKLEKCFNQGTRRLLQASQAEVICPSNMSNIALCSLCLIVQIRSLCILKFLVKMHMDGSLYKNIWHNAQNTLKITPSYKMQHHKFSFQFHHLLILYYIKKNINLLAPDVSIWREDLFPPTPIPSLLPAICLSS